MQEKIRVYIGMTIGVFITAVALNLFFVPHKIAAGGISGLSTVLHYLFNFPVGVIILSINIPIFLVGLKVLGSRYGFNTLYCASIFSLFIDLTAPYTPVITDDILLNALYGGIMTGIGLGLVFKFRGNTAGTALLATIFNKLFNISIGRALFLFDVMVVALAGIVFGSAALSLYAVISIFVSSQIIDLIQEGKTASKAFFIMAGEPEELSQKIFAQIDRGATYLQAMGAYTKQQREMLLCIVSTNEVAELKAIVHNHDPNAFMMITDAHEVIGEGFHKHEG